MERFSLNYYAEYATQCLFSEIEPLCQIKEEYSTLETRIIEWKYNLYQ